jgi:DNA-binding NarL/FixJ family response regulator
MAHRVLIADESDAVRAGLRVLLDRLGGFEVIGEAIEGRGAVGMTQTLSPDLVLLDIHLPGQSGSDCTREILKSHAHTRVIVVSTRVDQRQTTSVLDAGAVSFVLKDRALKELPSALRAVMEGKTFLSPEIANVLTEDRAQFGANRRTEGAASTLSPRERQVLQLVAEGKTNKEAAVSLAVSIKTIETHRAQLMEKLGIRTVAGLTKFAIREGITSLHV